MAKRRRTEIARIADPAARLVTYSKRRKGLFNKASELCHLCGARAAVILFSPAGKPCSFGHPSAEEVIRNYLGEPAPLMGLSDWVDCEIGSCETEEELESLIAKYESLRNSVSRRLEDSAAIIGVAGHIEDDGSSETLSDQEIDSLFESFKSQCPALFGDSLGSGDGHSYLNSKSVTGGGSWGVDSTPMCSCLERPGFYLDNCFSVPGDCVGDLPTLSESSAIPGGSLGEELMGFNADEFLNLFDDYVGGGDQFLDFSGRQSPSAVEA